MTLRHSISNYQYDHRLWFFIMLLSFSLALLFSSVGCATGRNRNEQGNNQMPTTNSVFQPAPPPSIPVSSMDTMIQQKLVRGHELAVVARTNQVTSRPVMLITLPSLNCPDCNTNKPHTIQKSDDVVHWTNLPFDVSPQAGGFLDFQQPGEQHAFYRVKQ